MEENELCGRDDDTLAAVVATSVEPSMIVKATSSSSDTPKTVPVSPDPTETTADFSNGTNASFELLLTPKQLEEKPEIPHPSSDLSALVVEDLPHAVEVRVVIVVCVCVC